MFCNEEDLKNKVILPYLQDIGFQPSDVSFEKGFSIRLGRAKYKIGSEDGTAEVDLTYSVGMAKGISLLLRSRMIAKI